MRILNKSFNFFRKFSLCNEEHEMGFIASS